jgi:hypothetical protein
MKNITNTPRTAALIGFLLAMPLTLLLLIMLYEVEPFARCCSFRLHYHDCGRLRN